MPEIRHQLLGSAPEIELGEIHIPDDKDLGTGTFTTVLKPDVLTSTKHIVSAMVNPPSFQISMTLNPNRDIPVLLGRVDGSEPISTKMYLLPAFVDITRSHTLVVEFSFWQITALKMNGVALPEK